METMRVVRGYQVRTCTSSTVRVRGSLLHDHDMGLFSFPIFALRTFRSKACLLVLVVLTTVLLLIKS